MALERIVLIDGRFELLNRPDRIDVFDIRNLKKDKAGDVSPIAQIPLTTPANDRDAGKMALAWLRDEDYLTQSEYYHFLDILLATQPADNVTDLKNSLLRKMHSSI
jgi:hypothetical protein